MKIKLSQINIKNIWAYFQGNTRFYLNEICPSVYNIVVRKHIREQISARLICMNKYCRIEGYCIHCGCETPNLQYANKTCDGNCYPEMLSKKQWYVMKQVGNVVYDKKTECFVFTKDFLKTYKTM